MSSDDGDGEESWIEWFCGLQGHEMFCEVDRGYIEDGFNLYGLRQLVPRFSECLDVILDRMGPDDSDEDISSASCELYGLIHARYIISNSGLEAMYHKYTLHEFGVCPRVHCRAQPVLPVGTRDDPKQDSIKIFCPKCQEIYSPPIQPGQRSLDGAYFGTTFANLFFMTYEHLIPEPPVERYIPKVFGFSIHHTSIYRRSRASQQRNAGGVAGHREGSRATEGGKERRTSPVYSHGKKAGKLATPSANEEKLDNGSGGIKKRRISTKMNTS
mmetsp:Transcript_18192/g.31883  ORF Transcript_18192/g.31883 Transcript_18192/m.31883 type:complete len:271 (+) Transcript_18192:133-945(+)